MLCGQTTEGARPVLLPTAGISRFFMNRYKSRETVFCLLFEFGFDESADPETILANAEQCREFERNEYIAAVFFGVCSNLAEIDSKIEKYSKGWSKDRISGVSLAAMRLSIFEIEHVQSIPDNVSINEAIELVRNYDGESAVPFVNGILNAVMKEKPADGSSEN